MERPIRTKFNNYACELTLNNTTKNYLNRSTGSDASYINQIGILWSRPQGTSDSHQFDITCYYLFDLNLF